MFIENDNVYYEQLKKKMIEEDNPYFKFIWIDMLIKLNMEIKRKKLNKVKKN